MGITSCLDKNEIVGCFGRYEKTKSLTRRLPLITKYWPNSKALNQAIDYLVENACINQRHIEKLVLNKENALNLINRVNNIGDIFNVRFLIEQNLNVTQDYNGATLNDKLDKLIKVIQHTF